MEKKSRLRGPNFTSCDSSLLCDIVSKYKDIIENKKTDGANLVQKQKAWNNVVDEFNATTIGHHRTVESLQQNYKNLKRKAKKSASDAKMDIPVDPETILKNIEEYGTSSEGWEKVSEHAGVSKEYCQKMFNSLTKEADTKDKRLKKIFMGTGGGPPPKDDDDPLLEKVKGLVGPTIDGLYTIYDGDSSIMRQLNATPIEIKCHENKSPDPEISINTDEQLRQQSANTSTTPKTYMGQDNELSYFTNNRANLKKKPHDLLTRKRKLETQLPEKQSVSEKFKVLAAEKMEMVATQKELLKIQLVNEQEKLEHSRLLRAMELQEAKAKYTHNEKLRQLELEKYMK